jgi:Wax ester synthase-like Acyl-CoA acyltransferase domain
VFRRRLVGMPFGLDRPYAPLWTVYVIERLDQIAGLPKGCFALFSKLYHASVDGMAMLHLLGSLHSNSPQAMCDADLLGRELP